MMSDSTQKLGCARDKIDGVWFSVCKYENASAGNVHCLKSGCPEQTCGQEQEQEQEPECELTESGDQSHCLVSAA